MNRRNIIQKVVCALLATFSFASARAADDALRLGYCKGNGVVYEQVSTTDGVSGSAILLPAEKMQTLRGCSISVVNVSFETKPAADAAKIFISKDLGAAPLYTQTVSATKTGWNAFALSTPYIIDGESIYIGYEVSGLRYLYYCNPFATGEEWIKKSDDGWTRYDRSYSAAVYVSVTGEGLPLNNVMLTGAMMAEYATVGQAATYGGTFTNLGPQNVTSVRAAVYADGREIHTELIEGLNVKELNNGSFSIKGLVFDEEGDREIQIGIIEVNGKADDDPSDNMSRKQTVICRKSFEPRTVLLEVFSTERCSGCASAHAALDKMLEGKDDVIEVGHHAGFYTDAHTIQASVDYEWFYKENKLYAPAMMTDRTYRGQNYPSYFADGTPMISNIGAFNAMYAISKATPAQVSMTLDATLDEAARRLTLTVEGKAVLPVIDNSTTRLTVLLTEDSIFTANQSGTAGEFWHRHAARLCLTPSWGDAIDNIADGFKKTYTADIPAEWDMAKMQAVAFVGNYDAADKNNCPVYNAAAADLKPLLAAGIADVRGASDLMIDVAGGTIILSDSADRIAVYDLTGRRIAAAEGATDRLSLPEGTQGMLVVKAVKGDRRWNKKVIGK